MKRFRWTKEHRINRSKDFQFLKRKSKRFYTEHFGIWFYDQKRDFPPVRLAVVVKKKIGKAVIRNRIRRLVREFFRLHQFELPSGDYVVIVKKAPKVLKYGLIEEELSREIEKNVW